MTVATKKILALAVTVVAALSLTSCSDTTSGDAPPAKSTITYEEAETPQGTVPCLVLRGYGQGGIDCHWEAIRER